MARTKQTARATTSQKRPKKQLAMRAARCRVYHTSNSVDKVGDLGSVFVQQSKFEWRSWRVNKHGLEPLVKSIDARCASALVKYPALGPTLDDPESVELFNTYKAVDRLMDYPSINTNVNEIATTASPTAAALHVHVSTSTSDDDDEGNARAPLPKSSSASSSTSISSAPFRRRAAVDAQNRIFSINADARLKPSQYLAKLSCSDQDLDSTEYNQVVRDRIIRKSAAESSSSSKSSGSCASSSHSSSSLISSSSSSSTSSSSSSSCSNSLPSKAKRFTVKSGGNRRTSGPIVLDSIPADATQPPAGVVCDWSDVSLDTRYDVFGYKLSRKEKESTTQIDNFVSEFIHVSRSCEFKDSGVRHCSSNRPSRFPGSAAHKRFEDAARRCKDVIKEKERTFQGVKPALAHVFACGKDGALKHSHTDESGNYKKQEHVFTSNLRGNEGNHRPQFSQWTFNTAKAGSRPRVVNLESSRSSSSSSSSSSPSAVSTASGTSSSGDNCTSASPPSYMLSKQSAPHICAQRLEYTPVHTYSLPPLPYHLFRYPDYSIPISMAYQVVPKNELDSSEEDPIRLVFLCLKPAPVGHPWGPWPLPTSEASRKIRRYWAKKMFEVKQTTNHLNCSAEDLHRIQAFMNMTNDEYFNTWYDTSNDDGSRAKANLVYEEPLLSVDIENAIELGLVEVKPVVYNDCPRALRDFQTWAYDQYIDLLPPLDCAEETCARSVCSQVFCAEPGCPLSLCAFHASTLLWGSTPGAEIKFDGAIWIARCCSCHEQAVWDNVVTKANSDKFSSNPALIPSLLTEYGPHRYVASYKPRPTVILTVTASTDVDVSNALNSSIYVTHWLGGRNFNLIFMEWKMYANQRIDLSHFKCICSQLQTLTYSQIIIFFMQHRNASGITSVGKDKHGQDLSNIDPLEKIAQAVLSRDARIEMHCVMVTCALNPQTLSAYLTRLNRFQSFTGFSNTLPIEQGILYCANALKNWLNVYSNTYLTQALLNNTTQSHVADLRPIHCVRVSSTDISPLFCLTPQGQPCEVLSLSQTSASEHKVLETLLGVYTPPAHRSQTKKRAHMAIVQSSSSSSAIENATRVKKAKASHSETVFPDCFDKSEFFFKASNVEWQTRCRLLAFFDCKKLFQHILFLYSRYSEKGGIILILRYVVRAGKKEADADETVLQDYYQALCMVDQYLAQSFFNKTDNMYLPDECMTRETVTQCRWGFQNEKSWYRGNQLLQALGNYIHGSEFVLRPVRGNRVSDDTPGK